jgi:RimJ/RimL family protein N-acetyltransferase
MQIETERLVLRTPSPEDADDLLDFVSDPEVMRRIGGEAGDRDDAVAAIERWLARWEDDGIGHFCIVRDGRVLGRAGFFVWDRRTWQSSSYAEAGGDAETELGWTLAREHWGNGYATEAALAARDWAYEKRGVDRIISLIAPDNARSIRVAEKLGATPEETISTFHGRATVWVHPR